MAERERAPLGEHRVDEVGVGGSGHDLSAAVAHQVEHSQRQSEPLQPLATRATHHLFRPRTHTSAPCCGTPYSIVLYHVSVAYMDS
jgi:hypothetical protein